MLADAKTLLKKFNIPLTDENFVKIRTMLDDKHLKYCYMLTYFFFAEHVTMSNIIALYQDVLRLESHLNKLYKDVTTYRDFKELLEDLKQLNDEISLLNFLKLLPKDLESEIVTAASYSNRNKLIIACQSFFKLEEFYQKEFIKGVSRYLDCRELLLALNAYIKYIKLGKALTDIKNQNIFGVKKIYETDKLFLVECTTPEAIKKIGTTSWCIARDQSHWHSYISNKDHATQYVLWNANLGIESPNYQIAFTVAKGYGDKLDIVAHNRRNDAINLFKYLEDYQIKEILTYVKKIKTDYEILIDALDYSQHYPKKNSNINDFRLKKCNFYSIEFISDLTNIDKFKNFEKYTDNQILKILNSTKGALTLYDAFLKRFNNNEDFWLSFVNGQDDLKNNSFKSQFSDLMDKILQKLLEQKFKKKAILNGLIFIFKHFSEVMIYSSHNAAEKTLLNCLKNLNTFIDNIKDKNFKREIYNVYQKLEGRVLSNTEKKLLKSFLNKIQPEMECPQSYSKTFDYDFYNTYTNRWLSEKMEEEKRRQWLSKKLTGIYYDESTAEDFGF